ncbi:MAG: response regulator receiver [Gemmatimonadetes bacterium]|nr:response regulator receiver [Gemmatimonadota bacterium]
MTDCLPCAAMPVPHGTLAEVGRALAARPYARRGAAIAEQPICVILVDDHTIVRAGLKALLHSCPDIRVVGEATGGDEALILTRRLNPDVVVMDLHMPNGDGASTTRALRRFSPDVRVLILSMEDERDQLIACLTDGARGYVSKHVAERELAEAIRVVAAGDVYVRPAVARQLAAATGRAAEQGADTTESLAQLSDRERTVFELTATGFNGPEIGRRLGITAKTVDTYKQRITAKLGISHRTDYVRLAQDLERVTAQDGARVSP